MKTTWHYGAVLGSALMLLSLFAFGAEITLFDGDNFQGRRMVVRGDIENLDNTGFNDKTTSLVVRDGVWEVCTDAYFRGRCMQLQPGEYPRLDDRFSRSISSLRLVGGTPNVGRYDAPDRYTAPGYAPPDNERAAFQSREGHARATLFQGRGFTGRSFPIAGEVVSNLAGTGFNDRASSLRVEEGYWIFCSDANFAGDCRTFGPGEYPELPFDLDRKISSGRRIHDRYPYSARPQWDRQ